MTIKQNLKNGKLVNLPFIFECFLMYNTPSSTKKNHKSTEPESCQMAKMCFFFLLLPLLQTG